MIAEKIILDVLILLITAGFSIYLNSIKKGVKEIKTSVDKLDGKVDTLDKTVKEHTITITDLTLLDSVVTRIELKVRQALEYIDKDDIITQSFILRQGEMAKECIEWAIHTHLKVSEAEIRAKYETCNIEVRDLLIKTDPVFSQAVRPGLITIVQHHISRVIEITNDSLFNSRLDRFFTLTEQTINEVLATIVRTRIENQIKK